MGRNPKSDKKKSKKFKSSRNSGKKGNFTGAAKIHNPCKIAKVKASFYTTSLFFWLGCSALQLDSSCLDLNPCPQDI